MVQPVVVGLVVSWLLPRLPEPSSLPLRWVELLAGFAVVCVGVAAYLAVDLGAGPTEVAALAWDPPVPFRWSYSAVQLIGAVAGYLLGASLGTGHCDRGAADRTGGRPAAAASLRFSDRSRWGRARPARTGAAT